MMMILMVMMMMMMMTMWMIHFGSDNPSLYTIRGETNNIKKRISCMRKFYGEVRATKKKTMAGYMATQIRWAVAVMK